jgi:hypothetical protein
MTVAQNITGNAQRISWDVTGYGSLSNATSFTNLAIQLAGTFNGVNCIFEGSVDGGTTWGTVDAVRSTGGVVETTTGVLSAGPAYIWDIACGGLTHVSARSTAWVSGTAAFTARRYTNSSTKSPTVDVALGTVTASAGAATIPASTTMQNAAVANGNGVSLPVTGYAGAIINIVSSVAMSGGTTVNFEGLVPGGTVWDAINAHQIGGTGSIATTTTTDGSYRISVAGYASIRARISAYSAGTTTITGTVSVVAPSLTTTNVNIIGINGVAPTTAVVGAAVPTGLVYEGGIAKTANPANATDGNLVGIMCDKAGRLVTTPVNVRENIGKQYTALAANTETTFITAGAAGVFNDITMLIISTAGAAAATLTIKDATGGTTQMVINYPDAALAQSGGPCVLCFNPPLTQTAAANNWTVTNSVATATNITAVFAKNL